MKNDTYSKKEIKEEYMKLLDNKEAGKYTLIVNERYSAEMPYVFWNSAERYYKKVEIDNLPDSILYVTIEERREN